MITKVRSSFRLLLEKPQPDGPCGHPADLYEADYRPGEEPALDSLANLRPLVDTSADESHPVGLPEGETAYHSLHGRPGLYRTPGLPVLLKPRIDRFAVSADGQDWAFVSDRKLYRFRPGTTPRKVSTPGHEPAEVAFSPDGELVYADPGGIYRAEGGEQLVAGAFRDFAFSPDGARIVYLKGDELGDQLRVRSLTGEDFLLMHSARERGVYEYPLYAHPTFSPDGSRVLYCVSSMDGPWGPAAQSDLRVIGASGGVPKVLCDDVLLANPA